MPINQIRNPLGRKIKTDVSDGYDSMTGFYNPQTSPERTISPVNPTPLFPQPNVTPINPTTDPTNPNYIPPSGPRRNLGGGGGGTAPSGGTNFGDLWKQWMGGTLEQMTNPEGLGNLQDYYGATIQDVGSAYKSGYRNLQEGLTTGGVSGSPFGQFAKQNWMGQQAGTSAIMMQQVRLKDAEERIRQKELGYANTLQAYGINQQLAGQKAMAASNVGAARASAEPAMMNALTNWTELQYKYGTSPE